MRIWAVLLAVFALALTIFLGVNWNLNHRAAIAATTEKYEHARDAATWAHAEERKSDDLRSQVDTHQLDFQAAAVEYRIAPPGSMAARKAIEKGVAAQRQIARDQFMVGLDTAARQRGPSYQVANARDRVKACEQSAAVYTHAVHRDEWLAYVAGALWITSGVVFALSRRI